MRYLPSRGGWIEVIIGSMFSGKTTELIRRCDRWRRAGRKVQIFSSDTRFRESAVVSHNSHAEQSTYATTSKEILDNLDWAMDIIGVDEGQFYDAELSDTCKLLAENGKIVIVAGLDQDYMAKPFDIMLKLMVEAEYIDKLCAVCVRCGNPAIRNFRKTEQTDRIVLGAAEAYEALCRDCYTKAIAEMRQEELFK